MSLEKLIAVGRGEIPADLVLKNGNVVNVLSGEIYKADVAIYQDKIAGIGEYKGDSEIDVTGKYVVPGFIDAHMHIESSMCTVPEFAKAVVPRGTTTVIVDPHEIANVMGTAGISYILKSSKYNPISVYVMLSSCVPATHLETNGAELKAIDLYGLLQDKWVLGLAEVMNYPGVLAKDADVLDKIKIIGAKQIDGHAPGLRGKDLCGYAAAGINSDHECSTLDEAKEKLRQGLFIMMREGTVTNNLKDLLPLVNQYTVDRCLFCTDDRTPLDLTTRGHINSMIRDAIAFGIDPMFAFKMSTINTARYFKLDHIGAIAPGYFADINILNDLKNIDPKMVFKNGVKVAENGKLIYEQEKVTQFPLRGSVNVKWLFEKDFQIPAKGGRARVIETVPGQIVTKQFYTEPKVENGLVVTDTKRDLLKMVVIERHNASGNIGLGLVKGFGLKSGALGSSVAHDSHNIIIVGVTDADILAAAVHIVKMQGGIVAVKDGKVVDDLPLPIAGLLSEKPLMEVRDKLELLKKIAKDLGSIPDDPYMVLSFLGLTVIPDLKLSDLGLVDVNLFKVVDLFETAQSAA